MCLQMEPHVGCAECILSRQQIRLIFLLSPLMYGRTNILCSLLSVFFGCLRFMKTPSVTVCDRPIDLEGIRQVLQFLRYALCANGFCPPLEADCALTCGWWCDQNGGIGLYNNTTMWSNCLHSSGPVHPVRAADSPLYP